MKLNEWLTANNMSRAAFAKKIGITVMSVSNYVRGSHIPDKKTMPRILKLTKGQVSANDFY